MKLTTLIVGLAVLCTPPLFAAPISPIEASMALTQDEDEIEDKRDLIKGLISSFTGHTKKKGKEDEQAVKVMDQLMSEFSLSGPKDRAAIVKALEKSMTLKRKDRKNGDKEMLVAYAAAVALGEMGPESVKPLIGLVGGKKLRGNEQLHRQAILSLGGTSDGRAVAELMDLMGDKLPIIQGAAIEALGNFREEEQKVRKKMVEEMLKLVMPIKSTVDGDSSDTIARDRYDVVAPATITALKILTGQNIRDLVEWQQWWNKNKRLDWDDEE